MSRLYVFGDSYSTPYVCVDPIESFWGLAAKYLQVNEIVNVSRPINSFDSVCQLLIGMQSEYEYNWDQDWFIIGIPPLERITLFDNHKDTEYNATIINCNSWDEQATTIQAHRGLVSQQFYGGDQFLTVHADRSWTETQILREIFLLTTWLDSKNASYLICNLSKPLDKNNHWGPSKFVLDYVINHNQCIVFDHTYYSVNVGINLPPDATTPDGWHGHHGPDGNKRYFEMSVKPKLQTLIREA